MGSANELVAFPRDVVDLRGSTASGLAVESYRAWLAGREKALKPVLQSMNADCQTFSASNGATGLQAACDAARTAGKPLKIVGSTPIDLTALGNWNPKPNGNNSPLRIFSDGEVQFVGSSRIEMTTNLELYNLKLKNNSGSTLFFNVSGQQRDTLVMGCDVEPHNGLHGVYATGSNVVQNARFRWNEFKGCNYTSNSFTMIQSEFSDNRSIMTVGGGGRHFFRNGGYRNTFLRNYIKGGIVGIAGLFDHSGTQFTNVPTLQSFIGDVADGNVFEFINEESFGYDVQTNSSAYHPGLTLTTVLGTSGSATNTPTLSCSYDGATSITQFAPAPGRFILVMSGTHAGKFAQIWSLTVNGSNVDMVIRGVGVGVPALKPSAAGSTGRRLGDQYFGELAQEDFATLTGAVLMVCDLSIGARVTNNVFKCRGFASRNTTVLSLWGNTAGFQISGNRFIDYGTDAGNLSYNGLRVSTVSGIIAKPASPTTGHCNWGATQINSQNIIQFPVGQGEIFDNDMGGMSLLLTNNGYSGASNVLPTSYPVKVYNNRRCQGGGPIIHNWKGSTGIEYSPATPAYNNTSTWVYGNT
jgi:hypothetical protein